jgi:predicted nucleic acid-binding protein
MIVIDASIAIKLLNPNEELSGIASALYQKHLTGEEEIVVPQFLFIEVANYLATKSLISEEAIERGIAFMNNSDFTIEMLDNDTLLEATLMARHYKTSVYDMLYAVTAKKYNCDLVTADEKFVRKVNKPFIKTLQDI